MKVPESFYISPKHDSSPEDVSVIHPLLEEVPVDAIFNAIYRAESIIAAISTNGFEEQQFTMSRNEILGCLFAVGGQLEQIRQMVEASWNQNLMRSGGGA